LGCGGIGGATAPHGPPPLINALPLSYSRFCRRVRTTRQETDHASRCQGERCNSTRIVSKR
jgi:hypothetical protein